MSVTNSNFKDAMSRWTSGVTIVTTILDGVLKGTTASSFTSVSGEPPLVLICLGHKLYTREILMKSGVFAVNILSDEQVEIGKLFAGMYPEIEDRFADKDCFTSETGSPIFPDNLAWVDCKVINTYEEGDHTIFIGQVLSSDARDGQSLAYHHRQWGQFKSLD